MRNYSMCKKFWNSRKGWVIVLMYSVPWMSLGMHGPCGRIVSCPVAALMALTLAFLSEVSPAGAAEPKELGKFGNWIAYSAGTGRAKICYIHAKPTKETGQYKRRGETYLQVAHRPGEKATDVVSLTAGYSYKKASEVVIVIGGARFPCSPPAIPPGRAGPKRTRPWCKP